MKLNLGCGFEFKEGYDNYDKEIDLDNVLPFEDNTVDEIFLSHVLEHINDIFFTLVECERILKPGGFVHIIVPHFSNPMSYIPEHKSYFNIQWFYGKVEDTETGSKERINMGLKDLKIIFRSKFLTWLVNINKSTQFYWENIFSWLIPAFNIELKLNKNEGAIE